ncbi:hypothetical protein CYMTET_15395 [Cymbomonas tetramitiformis]|uniref:Uncharacterized protein n=1 Tax=Cymbomonas tetramitiformis TaxID=36881 RepID=A0AAE0GFJ5_9CHLO|nr:hypothetical protein CYMTET_15395 [Cymbomonas tetramitiformis]
MLGLRVLDGGRDEQTVPDGAFTAKPPRCIRALAAGGGANASRVVGLSLQRRACAITRAEVGAVRLPMLSAVPGSGGGNRGGRYAEGQAQGQLGVTGVLGDREGLREAGGVGVISGRAVTLPKDDLGVNIRPTACGEVLRKLVVKVICRQCAKALTGRFRGHRQDDEPGGLWAAQIRVKKGEKRAHQGDPLGSLYLAHGNVGWEEAAHGNPAGGFEWDRQDGIEALGEHEGCAAGGEAVRR